MEINQLKPEEVIRDKCGFWVHPILNEYLCNLLGDRECMTESEHSTMLIHFNINVRCSAMEWDCTEELADKYWGEGDVDAVKEWQPTPPKGDGWFLIAINDTDDGPVAWWAKEKVA
ncbi:MULTISPECIES: hypothetical protein [Acinetobacter]|uniref:hypothetical protein n=1 Tax=Acinetobacter TaxID=469 RepID=UPI00101F6E35|nr:MULTISPECIES: hypothetical protein [Acinetobacter]MDM1760656.1 hypothetical protein [Acinetobacter sp. 251-1]RYL26538.1 hypothetical protein EWP19_07970 [Acinetobacter piscicola]